MNDLRNPILRDQRRNSPLIPDVLNENRNSGWYCPFEARRKIIDHDGLFATISEFVHHVAPNVSGTSGDKDRHCYRLYSLWKRPSTCLKLRNNFPSAVLSKPMPRTTLEVRWSSFPIKRLSGVSPDGMQAAVSADGRTVCVLIRRLISSCSRSTTLVVSSDAILGVARLRPDQHAKGRRLANTRHRAHRSAN